MDFRDAWIFSPGRAVLPIKVPEKKKERRYTLKEVKEAYDPVIAELKEKANMYRIKTLGRERVLNELIERGLLTEQESFELRKKHVRQVAKEEGFDFDAAQDKFIYKKKK
ncbi:MAG: hypothetical protein ACOCQI_03465 [Desulfosalsimonas sp.]